MLERKLLYLLTAIVCVLLALGLWPFHAAKNQVSWTTRNPGLCLGTHGTALSAGLFAPGAPDRAGYSIEMWLEPRDAHESGALMTFYDPDSPRRFSAAEHGTSLVLKSGGTSRETSPASAKFTVPNVFRDDRSIFLAVTAGAGETAVYVDGAVAARSPKFVVSKEEFGGTLIVANSPFVNDSWAGFLYGMALYDSELSAAEIQKHYRDSVQRGRPQFGSDEKPVGIYLFREGAGRIAHSEVTPEIDLYIPDRYTVIHKTFLESPWQEYQRSPDYWVRVVKNVIGFLPLGCCLLPYLAVRQTKRPILVTILAGAGLSLTIEVLQAYLPTRDSGVTDIFTNALGTAAGAMLFRCGPLRTLLERGLNLLSFQSAPDSIHTVCR